MNQKADRPFYDLLPEIYKDDKLMDALLAVYEDQYLRLERMIDELPESIYSPRNTPPSFLGFLQELVGFRSDIYIFTDEELRNALPSARLLQKSKGTRRVLRIMLDACLRKMCGYSVRFVIVEFQDWCDYRGSAELKSRYTKAFGGEAGVKVFVAKEKALEQTGQMSRLRALIEEYSPANAEVQLVFLDKRTTLERNSFLGYNTYL